MAVNADVNTCGTQLSRLIRILYRRDGARLNHKLPLSKVKKDLFKKSHHGFNKSCLSFLFKRRTCVTGMSQEVTQNVLQRSYLLETFGDSRYLHCGDQGDVGDRRCGELFSKNFVL
jgi:hypothetical protein